MLEFRFPELWKLDIYHFDYNSNIPLYVLQNAVAYCFDQIHVNVIPGSKCSVWECSHSQHAGGQLHRACRSGRSYPFSSFSSSPPHTTLLFFMTHLYVKKKLIITCKTTTELSDRHFHIFPPAASCTGKSPLWNHAFALLQVLFQCASRISMACAPAPFCVLYYLLSTPWMGCMPGLGFTDHSRTLTEASMLYHCTNAFFN